MIRFIIVVCLVHFSFLSNSQNADISLLRTFHNPQPLKSDPFFKFTSNTVAPLSLALPLTYFSVGLAQKDKSFKNNIYFQNGFRSGLSLATAGFLSYGLKYTIQRDRPYVTYSDITAKMKTGPHSFPSGHTTFAFATATSLALNHKKWYAILPVFVWSIGVGYSRMHLGVHYPSDVLTGALIGSGSSLLIHYLTRNTFK